MSYRILNDCFMLMHEIKTKILTVHGDDNVLRGALLWLLHQVVLKRGKPRTLMGTVVAKNHRCQCQDPLPTPDQASFKVLIV